MRIACFTVAVLAGACLLANGGQAQEKEVTLKGTLMCGSCALMQTEECTTIIQVKENDKDVTYYLKDKGNKEDHHEPVCGGGKLGGTVTGVVTEKDGKKWITPKKVTYEKK